MAKPNPIPDLKQRVKTLEGQVRLLLPLIEEEKAELRQKYEGEHQLRLQQEKSYQDQLGKLRQELEAGREMRLQLEESKEEALRALREELQAKGEELKKTADELQAERQKTAELRSAAEILANLEQKDSQGRTELHRAAERGETLMVQLLLDAGSQVNAEDHYGRTPLWLAAEQGRQDACRALLAAGARPGATIWPHCSSLMHGTSGAAAAPCSTSSLMMKPVDCTALCTPGHSGAAAVAAWRSAGGEG
ncbi:hypothetical protein ANN_00105 [Periplaneta americana]|uniref:Uncharacterized protein n=1 Tax=Periplaneta americana TaxID=6978 RepID=A0ABQ8TT02_PERAM|nr:hypothetical protein ANN_00105 [Periplaneta americana]